MIQDVSLANFYHAALFGKYIHPLVDIWRNEKWQPKK